MKGKFIVVYGINNIGKTTQAKKLVEYLKSKGLKVEYLKYPIYDSDSGKKISEILRSGKQQEISEEEFQTLYHQNRKEFEPVLKEKLKDTIIVAEDYTGTGISWGTVKGADFEKLKEQNEDLLKEDLAILMDGKRFLQGKEENHIHEENDEWINKVREVLKKLASERNWPIVNANKSIEEVFEDIKKHVDEIIS